MRYACHERAPLGRYVFAARGLGCLRDLTIGDCQPHRHRAHDGLLAGNRTTSTLTTCDVGSRNAWPFTA
jgi:hypothetical protein